MEKQGYDELAKQNLVDDIVNDSTIISNRNKIPCDCLECKQFILDQRNQQDKLWLLIAKGLALFVVGYMAYHICLAIASRWL